MLAIKDNIDVCVESRIRPRLYQKFYSTARYAIPPDSYGAQYGCLYLMGIFRWSLKRPYQTYLVSREESRVSREEDHVSRDENCVSRDESRASRDESRVSRDAIRDCQVTFERYCKHRRPTRVVDWCVICHGWLITVWRHITVWKRPYS